MHQTHRPLKNKPLVKLIACMSLFCSVLCMAAYANDRPSQNSTKRLVSAGGSITEIIYALGAQDTLVGADTSSVYPETANQLPKIGYYRQLSTEGVLSLSPTHLIATKGLGPSSVVSQLASTGLNITLIEQDRSVEGLLASIKAVGKAVDMQQEAEALATQVEQQIIEIRQSYQFEDKRFVFLMSAGERGLVAAGSNTVAHVITEILGMQNPFAELEGFKPISIEALMLANPDLILMPQHSIQDTNIKDLCTSTGLAFWASQKGCQLHSVESLPFLGLSPRLPQAIKTTAELLEDV